MCKTMFSIFLSVFFLVQVSHAKMPLAGDAAPNFSLTSTTGKKIALSDLRGKVILVGFFHICVPCMQQALEFNKVREQLSSSKLAVLGINTNGDSKEAVMKYLEGFSEKSLSKQGNFSLRIENPQDFLFIESEFEKFQTLGPIDITIVIKNSSHEESLMLLTGLQVPII